jgi:hypothetical protein
MALALLGGSAGAVAVSRVDSHPNSHGGAASDQYKPGKGCGDKNHKHRRNNQCKKHKHSVKAAHRRRHHRKSHHRARHGKKSPGFAG